jgi:hypothetical protein
VKRIFSSFVIMNFRIVIHLFATEGQRLRKPLMAYLVLLALPCVVFAWGNADGFRHPAPWQSGGTNITYQIAPLLWANSWLRGVVFGSQFAGLLMGAALAASIGIHGISSAALRPVRVRERFAARTLCLLVFFVLPQCLLLAGHLWIGGYGAEAIGEVIVMHGLCAMAYLGAALCFGAWCGGLWACLAGLVLALSAASLGKALLPAAEGLGGGFLHPISWGAPVGWEYLACAILLMFLLGGLRPWFRHRDGLAGRVAWCAVLTSAAMVLPGQVPSSWWWERGQPLAFGKPEPHFSEIRPVLRTAFLKRQQSYSRAPDGLRLAALMDAEGLPPGFGVVWRKAGETSLSETRPGGGGDSRKIAFPDRAARLPQDAFSPASDPNRHALIAAVLSRLGGKEAASTYALRPWAGGRHDVELGFLPLRGMEDMPQQESALVETRVAGMVYQYRIVFDIPVGEQAVRHVESGRMWRVRRFPGEMDSALVDVAMTEIRPPLGVRANVYEWKSNRLADLEFYYYLPRENQVIPLERRFDASGPVLTGEQWERKVFQVVGQGEAGRLDFTGMRLIALRAEVVAHLPAMPASGFLRSENHGEAGHDFQLSMRYGRSLRAYRARIPTERPDPETCTAAEFGRWLRIMADVTPTYDSPSIADLSMYVPRFAEIMVKVPQVTAVREALIQGLPESRRAVVLDALRDTPWPNALAEVAVRRGWTQEAAGTILARFREGNEIASKWLMALEKPETYPHLLERLRLSPDLALYENLRLLPGIEPLLDECVRSSVAGANLTSFLNRAPLDRNRLPFGPYLLAAKRGDAAALDAVLRIFAAGGTEGSIYYHTSSLGHLFPSPPAKNGSVNLGWMTYLAGKTADDFQYDPLARFWFPR